MPLGLYLHIPFCPVKCHYCNFVITAKRSPDFRKRFFEALAEEVKHARAKWGRLRFDTLYLGGGTPSDLNGEEMTRLLESLHHEFDFISPCEVSCEVNPGDVDSSKLEIYKKIGINRISLGVQAFQDKLLQKMGRPHQLKEIYETSVMLQQIGFHNVSMDLILRLPGQSLEDLRFSLNEVIRLKAFQVSLYDLEVHERTVFGVWQKRGELPLPSEELHAKMFSEVETLLTQAGYEHYEVSNFSKPGAASKHNLVYWHNQPYLGLGPGAFSYMDRLRYQFALDVETYLKKCEAKDWTPQVSELISDEKQEFETFLTGLRLREGVDLARFFIIRSNIESKLPALLKEGLVDKIRNHLRLTFKGRCLIESVLLEFCP